MGEGQTRTVGGGGGRWGVKRGWERGQTRTGGNEGGGKKRVGERQTRTGGGGGGR